MANAIETTMVHTTLEKQYLEVAARRTLAEFGVSPDNVQVTAVFASVTGEMVYRLRVVFLKGMVEAVSKTVRTPKTTWQHFKHQFFPKRLKRWFPVQYEEHKFQVQGPQYICPHIGTPGNSAHVKFAQQTRRPTLKELVTGE